MKKLILLMIITAAVLILNSCDNNSNNPTDSSQTDKGSLLVTSNPAGAQIWLDGSNTNLVTPDTVENIQEGLHNVTLKLTDYTDTTFSISITAGQMGIVSNVLLTSNIFTRQFGPVKIYETTGTTAAEPSGLDLSSGKAWGVSSDSSSLVDIYYSTNGTGGQGYLVQSADLNGLVRVTKFYLGPGINIFDEVDSPDKNTGAWINHMSDSPDSNYVFLYDHDGHYSKLKIVNAGGGVPGEPAWVQVQWLYNETTLDKRF